MCRCACSKFLYVKEFCAAVKVRNLRESWGNSFPVSEFGGRLGEGAIYDVGGCALTDLSGALSLVFDCAG